MPNERILNRIRRNHLRRQLNPLRYLVIKNNHRNLDQPPENLLIYDLILKRPVAGHSPPYSLTLTDASVVTRALLAGQI